MARAKENFTSVQIIKSDLWNSSLTSPAVTSRARDKRTANILPHDQAAVLPKRQISRNWKRYHTNNIPFQIKMFFLQTDQSGVLSCRWMYRITVTLVTVLRSFQYQVPAVYTIQAKYTTADVSILHSNVSFRTTAHAYALLPLKQWPTCQPYLSELLHRQHQRAALHTRRTALFVSFCIHELADPYD